MYMKACPKRRTATLLWFSAEENCLSLFCSLFNIKCYLDRHIINYFINEAFTGGILFIQPT